MSQARFDVVGIGNAIVDVLSKSQPDFLARHQLAPGSMTLIDNSQADALYSQMGPGMEMSGGSAANTLAGIASLGGKGAYIGKVKDDHLGKVFRHDLTAAGVTFDTTALVNGPSTARCLIFVTPDAQRTMTTYLGACIELGPNDVDSQVVADSKVTYLEGYLWDPPQAKDAFRKAIKIAHGAQRKVALTLSDAFCVGRYRAEFLDLLNGSVDILFANETEIMSLFEVNDFDAAVPLIRNRCEVAVLTRSAKGAMVVAGDKTHMVNAEPLGKVVDTTGAGDLYAAGFLFGYTQGYDHATSARIGSIAAGEVISHFGARPETALAELVKRHL
jgi:sugar/nucleoside kinase (ribokinase family)